MTQGLYIAEPLIPAYELTQKPSPRRAHDCRRQYHHPINWVVSKCALRSKKSSTSVYTVFFCPLLLVSFAEGATVDASTVSFVTKHENIIQLALADRDTTRIFALDDIDNFGWKLQWLLIQQDAISNDIDGDMWVNICKGSQVQLDKRVNFDDVFLAHFCAFHIFNEGN